MPGSIVTTLPAASVSDESVPEPVAECGGEGTVLDDAPSGRVRVHPAHAGARPCEPDLLRLEADGVGLLQLVREQAGRERARVVGEVAVDRAAGVDHDGLTRRDRAAGRPRVRL